MLIIKLDDKLQKLHSPAHSAVRHCINKVYLMYPRAVANPGNSVLSLGLRWVRQKFNEVITDPSCEFMLTVSVQSHGLNTVNSLQSF